jgi:hypothetical protein
LLLISDLLLLRSTFLIQSGNDILWLPLFFILQTFTSGHHIIFWSLLSIYVPPQPW